MEFIAQYGLFLLKSLTIVFAVFIAFASMAALGQRHRDKEHKGHIEIKSLNENFDDMERVMKDKILNDDDLKKEKKNKKKALKLKQQQAKQAKSDSSSGDTRKKRIYVIRFKGDIKASGVTTLRNEISAITTIADTQDEVVLCLESAGGMVHNYGLAASQLQRLNHKNIPLTVAIDTVAASGGYMMACLGDKIIAAPFAVIGSIGVLAQLPNFHRLLKKHDIDFECLTAGEYKRTLTIFGENTDKDREKFMKDLEDTHALFKDFVAEHRSQVTIDDVATGEAWYGKRALDKQLVDLLQTSDEYLMDQRDSCDIYAVQYIQKKTLPQKIGHMAQCAMVYLRRTI